MWQVCRYENNETNWKQFQPLMNSHMILSHGQGFLCVRVHIERHILLWKDPKHSLSDANCEGQLVLGGGQRGSRSVLGSLDTRVIAVLPVAVFHEVLQTLELQRLASTHLEIRQTVCATKKQAAGVCRNGVWHLRFAHVAETLCDHHVPFSSQAARAWLAWLWWPGTLSSSSGDTRVRAWSLSLVW